MMKREKEFPSHPLVIKHSPYGGLSMNESFGELSDLENTIVIKDVNHYKDGYEIYSEMIKHFNHEDFIIFRISETEWRETYALNLDAVNFYAIQLRRKQLNQIKKKFKIKRKDFCYLIKFKNTKDLVLTNLLGLTKARHKRR